MRSGYLILCWLSLVAVVAMQNAVNVSSATANDHILKRVQPEYPALAKLARLQGTVVLRITISPEGNVIGSAVVSGHPMLVTAAINAVKQWQYKPFIVEDRAATVSTSVEVPFSLGVSKAEYEKENQAADAYFTQQKKCRELVNKNAYADAEANCTPLIDLAETLPKERRMERITAYQYTGHAFFGQKKFNDALRFYQQELAIAQAALKPTDAELAYAYRDVARGFHGTGDLPQARSSYEQAEKTLQLAQEHIGSAFLQNEYAKTMKSLLRDHAFLLRQLGDESGADAMDKKAESISIKANLEDN